MPDDGNGHPEGSIEWLAERGGVLRQEADPDAVRPTGMCGSSKKCEACPSDFLCAMKASAEKERLVNDGWCPKGKEDDESPCVHWWDCAPCCRCGFDGGGEGCDCPRHNPDLYDADGNLVMAVSDAYPQVTDGGE